MPRRKKLPQTLTQYCSSTKRKKTTRKSPGTSQVPRFTRMTTTGPIPEIIIEDNSKLVTKVDEKMNNFFKSATFISSDEEEEVQPVAPLRSEHIILSDDSDDDIPLVISHSSKPSTSTSQVDTKRLFNYENVMELADSVLSKGNNKESTDKSNKNSMEEPTPFSLTNFESCRNENPLDDSIQISVPSESTKSNSQTTVTETQRDKPSYKDDSFMDFVDSILLEVKEDGVSSDPLKNDIKSLEEYTRETEEMLKSANTLINELKGVPKEPKEEKKVESPPASQAPPALQAPPVPSVGICPICLESLSAGPAAVTVCGHMFCKACITQTAKIIKKCPTCRKPINLKKIHPIYFN